MQEGKIASESMELARDYALVNILWQLPRQPIACHLHWFRFRRQQRTRAIRSRYSFSPLLPKVSL